MRVKLSLSPSGDMRLVQLRDTVTKRQDGQASPAPLVCNFKLGKRICHHVAPIYAGRGRIGTRHSIGRGARKFIRNCGAVIDQGRLETVVFLTGTLPGSTPEALQALAAWSAQVIETIRKWLYGIDPGLEFFGVWEYQRRGALHLHICIRCPSIALARSIKQGFKSRWVKAIAAVGRRAKIDIFARRSGGSFEFMRWRTRTDAQTVEKSVANYLGKYLSKGSQKSRKACHFPPSSWFFASDRLRQEVKAQSRQVQVSSLSPAMSSKLMGQAAAEVLNWSERVSSYQSPYDCQVWGLIALCSPVQGSLLFDYIRDSLQVLGASGDVQPRGSPCNIVDIATIFGGKVLVA